MYGRTSGRKVQFSIGSAGSLYYLSVIRPRCESCVGRCAEVNLYCTQPGIDAHVERLLGVEIARLLTEGKVQEISVNADGRIRVDDGGPREYAHLVGAKE
jgi:hypothetical protein